MSQKLTHQDLQKIMRSLGESKTIDLDVPIGKLVEGVAGVIGDRREELGLHILCCNEYFLVTGLVPTQFEDVRQQASGVREALDE